MRKRIIAIAVTTGLALSGGAFAAAQTDVKSPDEAAEKSSSEPRKNRPDKGEGPRPDKGEGPRPDKGDRGRHGNKFGHGVGHAIHGELIVPVRPAEGAADAKPTFETVEFDRGKVVRSTDEKLTLERPDGVQVTVTLNDETKFRGASKGSELAPGSPVFVVSKDGVARQVGKPKPRDERGKKADSPTPEKPAA